MRPDSRIGPRHSAVKDAVAICQSSTDGRSPIQLKRDSAGWNYETERGRVHGHCEDMRLPSGISIQVDRACILEE